MAQRRIMQEVEARRFFYLASLTLDTGSEYKSLYRAACRLNDMGRIGMLICEYNTPKVILHHPDLDAKAVDLSQLRRELRDQHRRRM